MKLPTIGILGGGQLGRMTCFEAHKMGYKTVIYTDQPFSPASFVSNQTIIGDYKDKNKLEDFSEKVDLITFEFENIPLETVEFLEKNNKVFPDSQTLKITQNRILEKTFLNEINVNIADFVEIKSKKDLIANFDKFQKSILKTATMGYDGKGQFNISSESEIEDIWQEIEKNNLTKNKLVLEKFCPFLSEISVIVARSVSGEIICYDPLTNIHKNSILSKSIYPAQISDNLAKKSKEIAEKIAQKINLVGVLAVEFFVMQNDELLVNEMAPRPHNSGHFSMDGCNTSQFEQLVRAINDIKLGDVSFHSHGYMINLIGEDIVKVEQYKKDKNAKIHLYSKSEVKEGRKMGHINIINK